MPKVDDFMLSVMISTLSKSSCSSVELEPAVEGSVSRRLAIKGESVGGCVEFRGCAAQVVKVPAALKAPIP